MNINPTAAELAALYENDPRAGSLSIHLTANHYPPVPVSMVPVILRAADNIAAARYTGDTPDPVPLPDGITYRGEETAPAWAIIDQHHADAYIEDFEDGADDTFEGWLTDEEAADNLTSLIDFIADSVDITEPATRDRLTAAANALAALLGTATPEGGRSSADLSDGAYHFGTDGTYVSALDCYTVETDGFTAADWKNIGDAHDSERADLAREIADRYQNGGAN
jgi:hypothetical protein